MSLNVRYFKINEVKNNYIIGNKGKFYRRRYNKIYLIQRKSFSR